MRTFILLTAAAVLVGCSKQKSGGDQPLGQPTNQPVAQTVPRKETSMTGKAILSLVNAHDGVNAESLAFSPDGKWLASGGCDGTFNLWDLGTGRQLFHQSGRGIVTSVAFSPDGKRLAWCSCGEAVMIRDQDGDVKVLKLNKDSSTESLAFSPNGDRLAAGGAILEKIGDEFKYNHGHLNIWETTTGRELFAGTLEQKPIGVLSFSPDGNWLALGTGRTVMRWDTATHTSKDLLTLQGRYAVKRVGFTPNGKALAAGVEDDRLNVWDLATGQKICTLEWHTPDFARVAISPNGELLASNSKTVKVWDPATAREIHSVDTGEDDDVCSIALSPDGKRLATGYVHGEVKVWKLTD